jgi:hypothetical protein
VSMRSNFRFCKYLFTQAQDVPRKKNAKCLLQMYNFYQKKMECIFRFLKSPQTKFRADSFAILAVLHADRQNDKNCESVKIKLSIVLNFYFAFPEFHFSRRAWAVSLETFNFYFGNFCGTRRYWSAEVPYKQSALFFQRTGQFEQYCSNIRVYFNIFNK